MINQKMNLKHAIQQLFSIFAICFLTVTAVGAQNSDMAGMSDMTNEEKAQFMTEKQNEKPCIL